MMEKKYHSLLPSNKCLKNISSFKGGRAKTRHFRPNEVLVPAMLPPTVYHCRSMQLLAHVPGKIFCSKQQMVTLVMVKSPFYFMNEPKNCCHTIRLSPTEENILSYNHKSS